MLKVHRKAGELLLEDCRKGDSSWLRVSLPSSKVDKVSGGDAFASSKPLIDLEEVARVKDASDEPPVEVKALYGVYSLLSGPYLAFIKDNARVIGKGPNDESIYQVLELEFIPVSEHAERHFQSHASKQEKRDQSIYLNMLKTIGKTKMFYFSFEYPLTLSAQRHALATASAAKLPAHARADESFFWNKPVLEPFLHSKIKLDRWIVPVINGFVKVVKGVVMAANTAPVDFFFFTRRSWHRVGTRFNVRGVDKDGHCANFSETEMIVQKGDGGLCSYVQIRGSIPLYWDQMVTLKYMPRTRYAYSQSDLIDWNELAFRAHFDNVIAKYGHVTVLNLIDRNGKSATVRDQNQLGSAFQKYTKKYNQNQSSGHDDDENVMTSTSSSPSSAAASLRLRKASSTVKDSISAASSTSSSLFAQPIAYIWFDFHDECRKMQWGNLAKLMESASECFAKYDWFEVDADGRVLKKQKGVFRVNCMDNLDRTNVVMSLVARRTMLLCLRLDSNDMSWLDSPFDQFESFFKNAWADNADAVSVMYAGTGALKTDFTRTGKRTLAGALQDGINSVTRYYLNNFTDGIRQDSLDLFVGNFTADRRTDSPFTVQQQNTFVFMLAEVLLLGIFLTGVSLSLHWNEDIRIRLRDGVAAAAVGLVVLAGLLLKKGSFRSVGRHCVCKPAFCSTGYIRRPEGAK
ncbi:hypothetical protein H257_03867 [Aphanomyces astaci]|uniref:SAC domain-containing protein n=2 Tax=Aphanomyces astaci TaxID=112090 RepID=W4H0H1_APHAT|nr:hypothetical protein H257_03867 [Aphanomyces astaci]ETV84769.1 hypothetical protein H257_03867 [Aphanomyces astaci]RQM25762.1 hypothetical protein B5M09_012307 [Aphanomyces astaci]|eukprot:XP_009826461.1 hypothetical protein H257_03867 [Aphanomyces astaci]